MYENATMEGKSPWLAIIKRGVLENRSQNLKVYENLDKPAFSPQSDNLLIYILNQAYIGGKAWAGLIPIWVEMKD